jgi:DnaJ-class molecular chaperone
MIEKRDRQHFSKRLTTTISFFMWSSVVFVSNMLTPGVNAGVPNLYSILDIPQNADIGEIKKAHRKRSKELHPDLNPGNEFIYEQY